MTVALDKTKSRDAEGVVCFSARLGAFARKSEVRGYEVCCPALELWTQGKTIAEAKKYIAEATVCLLEGCYQMGTLDEVLADCGFRFPGQKKPKRKKSARKHSLYRARNGDKHFRFSAKVSFAVV